MKDRIRLIRKKLGLSQTEFARKIGMTMQGIQKWEYGTVEIKDSSLKLLESIFKINSEWLTTGEGEIFSNDDNDDLFKIPIYDVYASAGYGALVSGEAISGSVSLPRSEIRKIMGANPKNIFMLYVKGDSMHPIMNDGDLLAIDKSRIHAVNGIFVARVDNDLYVKHVDFRPDMAILLSENSIYPPITAPYNEEFELIGRVIWHSRKLG